MPCWLFLLCWRTGPCMRARLSHLLDSDAAQAQSRLGSHARSERRQSPFYQPSLFEASVPRP